ncbi:MAG: hypothetical protein H0W76_13205 [Pyrinomonadaceae bacterium]|nr:hypothetical protein [Pyrinomonadaceae bacterium]
MVRPRPRGQGVRAGDAGKIWLRRKFSLDEPTVAHLFMCIHNNDRTTVFINGKQVRQEGENVIAVLCEQDRHKAFIDVGLIELKSTAQK